MGFLNKTITFGNSKGGKITSWFIIGFATFTFFMGILLTSLSGGEPRVLSIRLTSPQILTMANGTPLSVRQGDVLRRIGTHLEINSLQTPIFVEADQNVPVNFSIVRDDSGFYRSVSFSNNRVMSGGVAFLNLNIDSGNFTLPNKEDLIEITVTSGDARTTLWVNINIDPRDIVVQAFLQVQSDVVGPGGQKHWVDAIEGLNMRYFATASPLFGARHYRVVLTATLFGETLFNTALNPSDLRHFDFENISRYDDEINLFSDTSYIVTFKSDINITFDTVNEFHIWLDIEGTKFFTDSPFRLNIIGWTRF